MRIEITRHDHDDPKKALRREVWTFDYNTYRYATGLCMRLCAYFVETRKSTRCRVWDVQGAWPKSHVDVGAKTLPQPETVPDDIVAEVKQKLFDAFTVQIGWPR